MPALILVSALALGQTPQWIVVTADGPRAAAPLVAIDADGSVRLGGAAPARIAGGDIVEIRAAAATLPPLPAGDFLQLANGDWLPLERGSRIELRDERLTVTLAAPLQSKSEAALTLAQAAAALWAPATPVGAAPWPDLRIRPPRQDLVLLTDGERLEGALASIDEKVGVQLGARRLDLALAQVAAIAFNGDLQAKPRLARLHAQVVLKNGARLTFASLKLDAGGTTLTGVTPYGSALSLPLEQLVFLELRPGRITYLSELEPLRWRHTPFLDVSRPLVRDATLSGKPLHLGGRGHRYGLAMAPHSEATYRLDGGGRWFEAIAGVDPEARAGRLRFAVALDGKVVWPAAEGQDRGAADEPLHVRIDVRGAKTLTLITGFGSRGNVDGQGIWAGARLVR